MLKQAILKLKIKINSILISQRAVKPAFVNPYGVNPHLKPYDRPDNPFNKFANPQPQQPKLPEVADAEPRPSISEYATEFVAVIHDDITSIVDRVSGKRQYLEDQLHKRRENREKYSRFVELAMRGK